MAFCRVITPAHADTPKLYCYEANNGSQRVTFTRDGGIIKMHNELTGKDYEFPVIREDKAQVGSYHVIIFKAGDEERMIATGPEPNAPTEYTLLRAVNGRAWRYACYPQPTENPKNCVDFNGGFVDCEDLGRRKENLRKVPPSAYSPSWPLCSTQMYLDGVCK